ncbi:TetR family transcriptional regulator [Frankia sp. AgPm24]|nr:TetR family transcriptional regulator [Frankia sp. AgPm24]
MLNTDGSSGFGIINRGGKLDEAIAKAAFSNGYEFFCTYLVRLGGAGGVTGVLFGDANPSGRLPVTVEVTNTDHRAVAVAVDVMVGPNAADTVSIELEVLRRSRRLKIHMLLCVSSDRIRPWISESRPELGRRGWGGSPPRDDGDARQRILEAAIRCIEQQGPAGTTLSGVALELGITRRTIYRYFTSTEDLFGGVTNLVLDDWVERVRAVAEEAGNPTDMVVESVAYVIEGLPNEVFLTLLLGSGRAELFSRQMLTPTVIARCRRIFLGGRVDWAALGYDDLALDEFVEFLLRIIQSMVVAPSEQPRSGDDLRRYLRRWVAPALYGAATDAVADSSARSPVGSRG